MKDFVKWLGVNEKVAKVAVWILIIIIFLVAINTAMASFGFPNYRITYDNLVRIKSTKSMDYIASIMICLLNFYAIVLLVFRVKEYKKIFPYAALYVVLSFVILNSFNDIIQQLFILLYCLCFCYFYAGKKIQYLFFGLAAIITDTVIQVIWYTVKAKFVNYGVLGGITQGVLTLDYFIIIAIIILVKELYLKKRSENSETTKKLVMDRRLQERRSSSKETSKKSS